MLAGGVYLPPGVIAESPDLPEGEFGRGPRRGRRRVRGTGLTLRQQEVLQLLAEGKSNKEIAQDLGLAEGTVKIHVTAILKMLNVNNRTQAVIALSRLNVPT